MGDGLHFRLQTEENALDSNVGCVWETSRRLLETACSEHWLDGRLLLSEAMKSAEAPDQFSAIDRYDAAGREDLGQR